MALLIRNTSELLTAQKLKLKMLVYGPSGFGKTEFASFAPNPIFGVAETGLGKGIATVAKKKLPFTELNTYGQLEEFCSGVGLESYDTVVLDGFSYATDTSVKDYALSIPRQKGESKKRTMGIPEQDDYGVMAELERRLLAKLLGLDKHIVVTCLQDYYQPAEENKPEKIGGPDLPGMMRLGSAAMFDIVLRMYMRPALADPKDAKSRYNQRVFQVEGDGKYLAKCRFQGNKGCLFAQDIVFDKDKRIGTFDWMLKEAINAYEELVLPTGGGEK